MICPICGAPTERRRVGIDCVNSLHSYKCYGVETDVCTKCAHPVVSEEMGKTMEFLATKFSELPPEYRPTEVCFGGFATKALLILENDVGDLLVELCYDLCQGFPLKACRREECPVKELIDKIQGLVVPRGEQQQ